MTQIQLELGGELRTLKFSMGTLKFIGELIGSDPLSFGAGITENPGRLYDMVKTIVHAGMLQYAKSNKQNVGFNSDDVDDWVSDLDTATAMEIIGHYSKAFSAGESDDPNVKKVTILTKN
jgi:hypothetical protein